MTAYKHPYTDADRAGNPTHASQPEPGSTAVLDGHGWRWWYRTIDDDDLADMPTPVDFTQWARLEAIAAGLEPHPSAPAVVSIADPVDGGTCVRIPVRGLDPRDAAPRLKVVRRLVTAIALFWIAAAIVAILALVFLYDARPTAAAHPAIRTGVATYCAPTPTKCQGWGGGALVGAVRSFSSGDTPYRVEVCTVDGGRCVTVRVVSYCACGTRHGKPTLIDLSPAAFRRLAPLSRGVIDVTVRPVGGGAPIGTIPPTDTQP